MDTGGLAQNMTYNTNNLSAGGSFASRGKGAHIKRLSVAPSAMGSINENEVDNNPAPRTSRAHMLSGLRTAPKVNTNVGSASAPHSQTRFGRDAQNMGQITPGAYGNTSFNGFGQNGYQDNSQNQYMSQQVLAPPMFGTEDASQMDPEVYQQLMMQNLYLAQRQQQLQQQLMNVQAAAQQFQGMSLNGQQSQYGGSPMSAANGIYNQQLQNGMQPVIQPVPGQSGMYCVYNPMTGQSSFYPEAVIQQMMMQQQQAAVPQSPATGGFHGNAQSISAANSLGHQLRRDNKSPPSASKDGWTRTFSPPRQTPSPPQDVAPLPEPSANAYRPGHRRSVSNVNRNGDAVKPAARPAGVPQTPVDGTFGLGLGRAGEHPIRQPRNPPGIEELTAAPTSKHEGSKNFATRQRRRALFSLVRAGNERRVRPGSANGDLPTPNSEQGDHLGAAVSSSDGESDSTPATGSLSAHSSYGSLKAAAGGAIGSEMKNLKERSRERAPLADSFARRLTSDSHGTEDDSANAPERRRTPMLVLTSAEKRKTSMNLSGSAIA